MIKKILISLFIFFSLVGVFGVKDAEAININNVEYNNIRGWGWSSNIGAVFFSCYDAEAAVDGVPAGEVTTCTNSFGVYIVGQSETDTLNRDAGDLMGRAWSPNVGWISFERSETGNPPLTGNSVFDARFTNSNNIAELDRNTNTIVGWARVLSACSSVPCTSLVSQSWDGWIYFANDQNGVKIGGDNTLSGRAWGGDTVVGWINFENGNSAFIGNLESVFQNSPPVAIMNIVRDIIQQGQNYVMTINVDASGSYDPDSSDTLSYFWSFGDGGTASDISTSYIYRDEGNYNVSLLVSDNVGNSNSTSQVVSFTSPNFNACLIACNTDAQCNTQAGNYCYIEPGQSSGYCMSGGGASGGSQNNTNIVGDSKPLTNFDCKLKEGGGALSECKQLVEVCPSSGVYTNGVNCNPNANPPEFILSTDQSDFQCGVNSIKGPFCIGPELEFDENGNQQIKQEICSNSGVCSDGTSCVPGSVCPVSDKVYSCMELDDTAGLGSIGGYSISVSEEPKMPIGVQPGGEACTKPTGDGPNNCEGINGCLYYNFDRDGGRINNNSVVNCVSKESGGNLSLSGCFYYAQNGEEINVCENDYPTGCVYYANGLTNCLPSKSYTGLPEDCRVVKSGNNTIVDCTQVDSDIGGGCVFLSDGRVDCTYLEAEGRDYGGCIYEPNPKDGIQCPGFKKVSPQVDRYVGCVLTDDAVGSYLPPVNACLNDGTCPNQGEICLNGSCVSSCIPNTNDACSVGQVCSSFCPSGQIWDGNACIDIAWSQIPECKNSYLKNTQDGEEFSTFTSLPTGTTRIYMGVNTDENLNCRYSTDPLASFGNMLDFNLTGELIHETLLTGMFPLPEVNRYLVRCQNPNTQVEVPACKVSVRVGQECSSNADCGVDEFCNANNYCEIPQCSGAIPDRGTTFPANTQSVNIGMSTEFPEPAIPSVCRFSNDPTLDFQAMQGIFGSSDNLNHLSTVSDVVEGYNAYYVKCQSIDVNAEGNQDISNNCKIDFRVGGITSCSSSADCAEGEFCNPLTNTCVAGNCPNGTTLDPLSGICVGDNPCSSNENCTQGQFCNPLTNTCSSCPTGSSFNILTNRCEVTPQCPIGTSFNSLTGVCERNEVISESDANPLCNVLGIEFQGTAPGSGIGPLQNCSIAAVLLALLQWFAWFVTLFAVVYGLRGGYLYISSAGDQKKLDESKKAIIYTMVGVIVSVLSFSVIAITRSILGI